MGEMPQEDVLVVPRALFERVGAFQGFCGDTAAYLPTLLDPTHTSWRPRATVEDDPSFKQQNDVRYQGRDLALWRGRHARAVVVLGTATPSLEPSPLSSKQAVAEALITSRTGRPSASGWS
jgi:hypothetical protein